MNKQRVLHALGFLLAIFLAGLADHLQHSTWVLAPALGAIVTALLVDLRKVFGGPPVGPSAAVALLAAVVSLGSFGCWLTKPPPVSPTVPDGGFADASAGQTFVDCSDANLHARELEILPDVETALATADYAVELANLLGRATLAEVECAVQYVVNRASGMARTTGDPVQMTEATNGRAWLAAHPVTFAGGAK